MFFKRKLDIKKGIPEVHDTEPVQFAKSFELASFPVEEKFIGCFMELLRSPLGSVSVIQGAGKKSFVQSVLNTENFKYRTFIQHQRDGFSASFICDIARNIQEQIIVLPCANEFFGDSLMACDYPILNKFIYDIKEKNKKIIVLLDCPLSPWLRNLIDLNITIRWSDSDYEKLIRMQIGKNLYYTSEEIEKVINMLIPSHLSLYTVSGCVEHLLLEQSRNNKEKAFNFVNTIIKRKKDLENPCITHISNVINEKFSKEFVKCFVHGMRIDLDNLVNYIKNTKENFRFIFYGKSGTGKTTAAIALLNICNKQILYINAADLLSAYVGETESNIKHAFEDAERNDFVIVINEAGFFVS